MDFQSWQIFQLAKKKLPKGRLQSIYTKKTRMVDLWAANPRDCEHTARNPIDRIRMMLDELSLAGFGEYSQAAIDYMAEPLGLYSTDRETARSDKKSVDGEAVDLTVAVGNLLGSVREALADDTLTSAERIRIKGQARAVITELEQLLDAAGMNPKPSN